ncbi:MAG: ferritin-like domain-containing protein [Pyrinomonadaceae bacterium]
MSNNIRPGEVETPVSDAPTIASNSRRAFLVRTGWATAAMLALGSIGVAKGRDNFNGFDLLIQKSTGGTVDLGSGDFGVLNYAYALEQLEAAFYTQAVSSPYSGMNDEERFLLTSIRDHEVAHREFFKAALGKKAIPGLQPNFSAINFSSRDSVLGTARTFEDLGVSAYNGAGQLLKKAEFLLVAGKIVSVEARHAAVIRDLLQPNSSYFSGDDVVNAQGLDMARTPAEVLAAAAPFISTPVTATKLPAPKA